MINNTNLRKVEVIQVVRTEVQYGEGVDDDPVRKVFLYWSLDGNLIAVNDPWKEDNGIYVSE